MLNFSQRQATLDAGYSLFYFVARSGEEGTRCVESLEHWGQEKLIQLNGRALQHLRRREIDEGIALLSEIDLRTSSVPVSLGILRNLLRGCWYHGAQAYLHYCVGSLEEASRDLDLAYESVASAIGAKPFLLPLVEHLLDFRMQHSRVARKRRHWRDFKQHVEILRAMTKSQHPLCRLTDGSKVFLSALGDFYTSLPLDASERKFVYRYILNDDWRIRNFERTVASLCLEPGFVILYT